jgi:peptide deformylase
MTNDPFELVDLNDPVLRERAAEVADGNHLDSVIGKLWDVMKAKNGFGIAAPQCGLPLRIIIVKDEVMINPEYDRTLRLENEIIESSEGCLSIPGLRATVKRHKDVAVRYRTPVGSTVMAILNGDQARCFQHEFDHLNGILFTDYLSRFKQQRAIDRAKKLGFNYTFKDFPNAGIPVDDLYA